MTIKIIPLLSHFGDNKFHIMSEKDREFFLSDFQHESCRTCGKEIINLIPKGKAYVIVLSYPTEPHRCAMLCDQELCHNLAILNI